MGAMSCTSEIRTTIFEPFPDFGHRVGHEKVVDDNEQSARAVRTELVENLDETATLEPIQNRGDFRSTHSGLLGEVALRAEPLGPLPAGAIARALRDRLDPTARRHLERRGRSLADLAGLVTPENGFPLSVEEHRRFVATDGSVDRIFRVAEWPRLSVRADWLAGFLCEQDVTRSFTVIYTPLGRRLARRQALAVATRVGASIDERELKGRRVGAEERRAQLAAEALDEELESGAEMELVAGLVDVTAESPDALDGQCERTCQSAANVGMELRSLDLRHAEALVAALPLGRVIPGRAR